LVVSATGADMVVNGTVEWKPSRTDDCLADCGAHFAVSLLLSKKANSDAKYYQISARLIDAGGAPQSIPGIDYYHVRVIPAWADPQRSYVIGADPLAKSCTDMRVCESWPGIPLSFRVTIVDAYNNTRDPLESVGEPAGQDVCRLAVDVADAVAATTLSCGQWNPAGGYYPISGFATRADLEVTTALNVSLRISNLTDGASASSPCVPVCSRQANSSTMGACDMPPQAHCCGSSGCDSSAHKFVYTVSRSAPTAVQKDLTIGKAPSLDQPAGAENVFSITVSDDAAECRPTPPAHCYETVQIKPNPPQPCCSPFVRCDTRRKCGFMHIGGCHDEKVNCQPPECAGTCPQQREIPCPAYTYSEDNGCVYSQRLRENIIVLASSHSGDATMPPQSGASISESTKPACAPGACCDLACTQSDVGTLLDTRCRDACTVPNAIIDGSGSDATFGCSPMYLRNGTRANLACLDYSVRITLAGSYRVWLHYVTGDLSRFSWNIVVHPAALDQNKTICSIDSLPVLDAVTGLAQTSGFDEMQSAGLWLSDAGMFLQTVAGALNNFSVVPRDRFGNVRDQNSTVLHLDQADTLGVSIEQSDSSQGSWCACAGDRLQGCPQYGLTYLSDDENSTATTSADSPAACCALCRGQPSCQYWTWSHSLAWRTSNATRDGVCSTMAAISRTLTGQSHHISGTASCNLADCSLALSDPTCAYGT
jgi:hypothetical protein